MAKIDYIQTSFAGGEFSGSLFGRTDMDQYSIANETVENLLVRPYGSVISTPGTKYIATASISATKVRIIPFVFSRDNAYVIEMGVGYFRFLTEDGVVTSNGTIFAVPHFYTEDELFEVQYTQKNDVIWLFHPDHRPQRLIRQNASYWTLEYYAFVCEPFLDDNLNDSSTLTVNDSTGTINITAALDVFTLSTGTTIGSWNKFFKIGGVLTDSTTGLDVQGFVKVTDVISTKVVTASVIATLTVTGSTTWWAEPAWTDENGYPGSCVFFEGRLFAARTANEPQKIWGSKPFIYDDFAVNSAGDDDGINIELASNEANEIQWLVSGLSLIAGTFGGEFVLNGADGEITPTNVKVTRHSSWGSEKIIPRRIGNFFYYIQRYGKKLRELFYFWDLDAYKSVDRTILSPHILGNGIVDMAYQQNPDTVIYCVRSDGTMATLTREIDQEVTAWSRQTTPVGTFTSICSIPSPTELFDQVWVVAERWVTDTLGTAIMRKYIEVFQDIEVPTRQDLCWYVHSGLRYSAYDATLALEAKTLTVTGLSLSATTGTGVVATTSDVYFESNDVNQRIRAIDALGNMVGELKITSYSSTTMVTGDVKYDFNALAYDGGEWGVSVTSISGLSHLEGMTVTALLDGGLDKPNKTVSLGAINLANDGFVVLIGLPYTQTLKTLPPEAGSRRGTSQGKKQRISQVAFKVNRSFKGFKTGGSADLAERVQFRMPTTSMGTSPALFTGIISNITFRDDYQYGSQVTVINDEPLPIEILSIISTIDTHDK